MKDIEVLFKWIDCQETEDLSLPKYQTESSVGVDIEANIKDEVIIEPNEIIIIPTGFSLAIPCGYEAQVRSRSGLAMKNGIVVVNSPGTIDADYRGEIKVGLINLLMEPYKITRGDRVAQIVFSPVNRVVFNIVDELGQTNRGAGGFGHTGV